MTATPDARPGTRPVATPGNGAALAPRTARDSGRDTTPYREALLRATAGLCLPDIDAALTGAPLYRATTPEGLLVLTLNGGQLPAEFLRRVHAFRLGQYVRQGWVDEAVAAERELWHEPYGEGAVRDFHTLVLERDSGRLRGYGTLALSAAPEGTRLGDAAHRPFFIERDYGFRLAEHLGAGTASHAVGEGKRLVRDRDMPRSQAAASVPWWVYLAWAHACLSVLERPGGAIVGDGKKNGAIHQLGLLGFDTRVLDLAPLPPAPGELFAPMWDQRERSYPFVLTDGGRLRPTLDFLTSVLTSGETGSVRARLTAFLEAHA
ncbi:hypothetical protein [Streptomyces sp. NPDC047046]|uniref:hypothetical protein n=1 Tax=Streptomyces sp. NPDC047046 TaxID=3155378 RepID=UPI0033D6FF71